MKHVALVLLLLAGCSKPAAPAAAAPRPDASVAPPASVRAPTPDEITYARWCGAYINVMRELDAASRRPDVVSTPWVDLGSALRTERQLQALGFPQRDCFLCETFKTCAKQAGLPPEQVTAKLLAESATALLNRPLPDSERPKDTTAPLSALVGPACACCAAPEKCPK